MVKLSRFLCVGPGGRKCSCYFPSPGTKARRALYRSAKRKMAWVFIREIEEAKLQAPFAPTEPS